MLPLKRNNQIMAVEAVDALPAAEKERVYNEIDAMTPQQIKRATKPISAREWASMHIRPR